MVDHVLVEGERGFEGGGGREGEEGVEDAEERGKGSIRDMGVWARMEESEGTEREDEEDAGLTGCGVRW